MNEFTENNRYLINTTEGYKTFAGLAASSHKYYMKISFLNGEEVQCSKDHIFWTYNNDLIKAEDILVGFDLKSKDGIMEVSEISNIISEKTMIDIIEVDSSNNNFFLSNDLQSHNCQFLAFEKLLVESEVLDFYTTPGIIEEIMGFQVYKEKLEHIDSLLIITIMLLITKLL